MDCFIRVKVSSPKNINDPMDPRFIPKSIFQPITANTASRIPTRPSPAIKPEP